VTLTGTSKRKRVFPRGFVKSMVLRCLVKTPTRSQHNRLRASRIYLVPASTPSKSNEQGDENGPGTMGTNE